MPPDEAPRTSRPQVPLRQRFMWGLGGFTDAMIFYGVFSLVNTIYVNARGVNAVLVGLACAVSRLLDSFSDPVVGHLSDNTRSRWGRRRPWMLAGILICAAVTLLLWGAPAAESSRSAAAVGAQESWWASAGRAIGAGWGTFLYLAGMITLLLAVGYTLFTIPHYAMGYEMTTDYDERTHLFKWRFVLFAAAGFLTPWLMPLCMWFEGDRAQVLRGSEGVFPVAAIAAVIILATGIPSLFCKEKVIRERGPRVRFLAAARLTFGNRPFLLLLASNFVARFGMAITGVFFYYVFVYHIGRGEQLAGAALLAVFFNTINAANFLAMAPIASLAGRIGKKPALLLLLAMSAVAYASLVFTFTSGDESFLRSGLGGSSWTLFVHWPTIVTAVLIGVFTNTMPMITNSMIADVCDYDELTSGSRREGFYGAVYTSTEKIAWSVSFAFQGILLVASGFDASLAQQAPETIRYWILALVITQPTGFLIGVVILLFYPLSRARVGEIRAALEARGGVNGVH